jgi:radical SAM protein with 4Fe4S-binding SPASM domain
MDTKSNNSLQIVAVEILEQCNLYCSFCVRNASKDLKGLLSISSFGEILDKLKFFDHKPQIALTGGEPLMHKNFLGLIQLISQMGFLFSITTNGTIHRLDILDALKEIKEFRHFIISIDSAEEMIHNQIRKGVNSFKKTIDFIELLNVRNIPFCINMTVNDLNYKTVTETIKLAKSVGAKDISIATVKPSGRGDATLSQIEQNEIIRQLFECMDLAKDGFRVRATDVTFFVYDLKNYETIATSGADRSCAFGNSSLHIQTNGNILGCTSCELSLGNVFEMPENGIRSLWEDNQLLNDIRGKEKLTGVCGGCKYKKFCGGCRCRAYALKDNLFGDDPYCPLVNNVGVSA